MKITKRPIDKYSSNSCREEESTAIKNWLASSDDEKSYLSKIELCEIKAAMWTSITADKKTKVIPLYKKILRYAVASSIIVGFIAVSAIHLLDTSFMSAKIVFNNTTDVKKEYQNEDMNFTLMANTKIDVVTNMCKTKTNIEVFGNMKIRNNTRSANKVSIHATCSVTGHKKEVTLKPNQTYYALNIKYKENEKLYILNKSQMENLPRHLAVRALSLAGKI